MLANIQEIPIITPITRKVALIPWLESSALETGAMKNPNNPLAVTMTPDANPVLPGNHFCAVDMMVV